MVEAASYIKHIRDSPDCMGQVLQFLDITLAIKIASSLHKKLNNKKGAFANQHPDAKEALLTGDNWNTQLEKFRGNPGFPLKVDLHFERVYVEECENKDLAPIVLESKCKFRRFEMEDCYFDEMNTNALIRSLDDSAKFLRSFTLNSTKVEGIQNLVAALAEKTKLKTLVIVDQKKEPEKTALAMLGENSSLKELTMRYCSLTDATLGPILQTVQFRNLTQLELTHNKDNQNSANSITDASVGDLVDTLNMNMEMKKLNLSWNGISKAGITRLLSGLSPDLRLTRLELGGEHFETEQADALSQKMADSDGQFLVGYMMVNTTTDLETIVAHLRSRYEPFKLDTFTVHGFMVFDDLKVDDLDKCLAVFNKIRFVHKALKADKQQLQAHQDRVETKQCKMV